MSVTNKNSYEGLRIADMLIGGDSWKIWMINIKFPYTNTDDLLKTLENPYCDYALVEEYTEDEIYFQEQIKLGIEHRKLLEQAVDGNINAALKYCRLEYEGKINHGAFG